MRTLILFATLVIATPAIAQDLNVSVSAESFTNIENTLGAVEIGGNYGRLSWFGFVEANRARGVNRIDWIAPLEVRGRVAPEVPVDLVARGGLTPNGQFLGVGARVILTQTPILEDITTPVFGFLAVWYLHTASGLPFEDEFVIAVGTKRIITIGGVGNVDIGGFYRIRVNGVNFGQQQVMLNLTEMLDGLSVGIEFETVNEDPTPRLGLRYVQRL